MDIFEIIAKIFCCFILVGLCVLVVVVIVALVLSLHDYRVDERQRRFKNYGKEN